MITPQVSILTAREADLPALLALEETGFEPGERWSERSWLGEILGDNRRTLVARTHQVVGAVSLQLMGNGSDLHRLVVAPSARRQGIGRALVSAGLEAIRHLGARSVILEVRIDNDPAIKLYQELGFEQLAARENYYGPGQHALILKYWDLQGPRPGAST